MKRIIFLLAFILISIGYSKAYSAPTCTSLLQNDLRSLRSELPAIDLKTFNLQDIVSALPLRLQMRMRRGHRKDFDRLGFDVSLGLFGSGEFSIRVFNNNNIQMHLNPYYENNINNPRIRKKAENFMNNVRRRALRHLEGTEISEKLSLPKIVSPHVHEQIFMGIKNGKHETLDALRAIVHIALGQAPPPIRTYWEMETNTQYDSVYYVDNRTQEHLPLEYSNIYETRAKNYAIPTNIPEPLYQYMTLKSGFSFYLSKEAWVIKGSFTHSERPTLNISLAIATNGRVIASLDKSSLPNIDFANDNSVLDQLDFPRIYTKSLEGGSIQFDLNNLVPFFNRLKELGYEQETYADEALNPSHIIKGPVKTKI